MSGIVCDKCGADVPSDARFCPQCADPVTAADKLESEPRRSTELVRIVCPRCLSQAPIEVSRSGLTGVVCPNCEKGFHTRVAEIRSKKSRGSKRDQTRSFTFRLRTLDGEEDLLEFDNASYDDFEFKSKDLAAFSYLGDHLKIGGR